MNTARLMDETAPVQAEGRWSIWKICDKVGNISLNGGKGVLEQLAELAGVQD